MKGTKNELVVLVHGFARSHLSLRSMERACNSQGYNTINWRYNSLHGRISDHVNSLAEKLAKIPDDTMLHGIGHSLGGIILRGAFSKYSSKLGRLVLLGTPNQGAQMIKRAPLLFQYRFIPQSLQELHPDSLLLKQLAIPNMEIGVVIGSKSFHIANPVSWLNQYILHDLKHDGTVEQTSTTLLPNTDLFIANTNHSFLPSDKNIIQQSLHFIKFGQFNNQ